MNRYWAFLLIIPLALAAEQSLPITDAQADVIVATEEATKEAEAQEATADLRVLQQRTYDLGDRKFTLQQVAPPDLPNSEESVSTSESTQSPLELEQMITQTQWIPLSAIVYEQDGAAITHLRWEHNDMVYEAWSEADFRLLRPLTRFSVDSQPYEINLSIFSESVEEMELRRRAALDRGIEIKLPVIPNLPAGDASISEYSVEADSEQIFENEAAFIPIDDLHAYYDAHHDELAVKVANIEALNAARKRYLAKNPPSKDTTLNYWIEEK